VGVSAAKGLALNLNIPIIGIGTLEATAYQHAETNCRFALCKMRAGKKLPAIYQLKPRKGWMKYKRSISPLQLCFQGQLKRPPYLR